MGLGWGEGKGEGDKEGVRESASICWWTAPKPTIVLPYRLGTSSKSPSGRHGLKDLSHHHCLPRCALVENWKQERSWGSAPATPLWDAGILTATFGPGRGICPFQNFLRYPPILRKQDTEASTSTVKSFTLTLDSGGHSGGRWQQVDGRLPPPHPKINFDSTSRRLR